MVPNPADKKLEEEVWLWLVSARVFRNPDLSNHDFGYDVAGPKLKIEAKDGVVRLTGLIATAASVERAGKVAARVPGVIRVENHLVCPTPDDERAAAIAAGIRASGYRGDLKVAVGGKTAWVTARVKGEAQVDLVTRIAARSDGISRVETRALLIADGEARQIVRTRVIPVEAAKP